MSCLRSSDETADASPSDLSQGWTLSKPRIATRFTLKVQAYSNAKFELGEKTGLKADPNQVQQTLGTLEMKRTTVAFPERSGFQKIRLKALLRRGKDKKRMR